MSAKPAKGCPEGVMVFSLSLSLSADRVLMRFYMGPWTVVPLPLEAKNRNETIVWDFEGLFAFGLNLEMEVRWAFVMFSSIFVVLIIL